MVLENGEGRPLEARGDNTQHYDTIRALDVGWFFSVVPLWGYIKEILQNGCDAADEIKNLNESGRQEYVTRRWLTDTRIL